MTARRYWRVEFPGGPQGGGNYYGLIACHLRTIPGGANQAVGGTATATTYYQNNSDYAAGNAFDSVFHREYGYRAWVSDFESGTPHLQYDLGSGNDKDFVELMLRTRDVFVGNTPSQYVVKSSPDASSWTTEWSGTVPAASLNTSYVFTKPGASYSGSKTKWKLDMWAVNAKYFQIARIVPRDASGNDLFPTDLYVESDWDSWNRNKWNMFAYFSDGTYDTYNLQWTNQDSAGWGNSDRRIELTFSGGVEIASMLMRSPQAWDGAGGGTPSFGVWSSSTDGGTTWKREWWWIKTGGWANSTNATFTAQAGGAAALVDPGGHRYWRVTYENVVCGFSQDLEVNEIDFRNTGSGPDITPVALHTISGGSTLNGPRAPYDRVSATQWNWDGGSGGTATVTYLMDFGPGNTPLFDRISITAGTVGAHSAPVIRVSHSDDNSAFTEVHASTGLTWTNSETKTFIWPLVLPYDIYASMDGVGAQDLRYTTPTDIFADWPGHSEPDKALIVQWPGEIFGPAMSTGSFDAYVVQIPRAGVTRNIYADTLGQSADFSGQDPAAEGATDVYLLVEAGVTSVTMPADFNAADNTVICYAPGGGGSGGAANGGAGGGGCSLKDNVAVTPGQVVQVQVSSGGTTGTSSGSGQAGKATFFNGTAYNESTFVTDAEVAAQGGRSVTGSTTGGLGGQAANGVGTTKYSGGNGGNGASGNFGGGGGGGAGHAGNGFSGSGRTGGKGGNTNGGNGGSPGTRTSMPTAGQPGSAFNITLRWNGTTWAAYSGTAGAGGGGGGHTVGGGGAAGGKYGGGGGSKRFNGDLSGRGGDGAIVIRYKPVRPGYSKGYASA